MSILEKMGLNPKKREASLHIGDKKKKEQKKISEKRNRIYRALIFITFLLIILISLPQTTFQPVANYTVNEPWRADDLTAPFTFSIKKTSAELEEERNEIRRQTPPVFHIHHNANIIIEARLDSVYRSLQPVFDSYLQWQRAKRNQDASAQNDSLRFYQEKNFAGLELDSEAWETLAENFAIVRLNNEPENRIMAIQIRNQLDNLINEILADGVIDRSIDDLALNEITLRNLRQRTERAVSLNSVRDPDEASEFARLQLSRSFMPEVADAAYQIYRQVIEPNWIYSEEDTNAILEEKLDEISTTKGAVDQGQIIVRRGDMVTPDIANKLHSLAEARAANATELEKWLRYSGEAVIIIIAAIMFLIYIYLYRKPIFDKPTMFLLVFLAMGIITIASTIVYPMESVNSYIVPIAVAPIILTIIFDSRVGLMATVTLAVITGLIHDNNFEYLVATIAACTLGVFSVRDIKKRSQFFFVTPGIVFGTYILVIGGFALARFSGWELFFQNAFFIAINAVFILFTYPLILLFEKMFKITTDFTLLELSDTNLPLMKELMTKAPGTFHHSLQVANLAESAASAIGANSLLCRVGAMYHDLGKMEKPGYFIENQNKSNDHDKIKPRMSALVIKAHVSDGVKIAAENDLPKLVIDFIKTHHGTSLIRFFYKKAQEGADDIQEDDFRYDGPIPFTKEQGILMLADGVEAASRSMKDPNYHKLENLINRLIDENVKDGQLSNCPLTFRQIQIIKNTFLNILVGVYHSRIEYPDEEKSNEKVKPIAEPAIKAAEGDTPEKGQDEDDN